MSEGLEYLSNDTSLRFQSMPAPNFDPELREILEP
jgi:hypothetical protein